MILYIAEKPSLGRAIAEVLPKPHRKEEGCIYAADGSVVSWCIGHLLEQAEPHQYDPRFKQWRQEDLPIVPQQWQWQPKPKTRKQLSLLKKLIKSADQLVHAGDPDREGQLLVDEVLSYLNVPGAKRSRAQRCLINDLNPQAIRRALSSLRLNQEFIPLSTSALARARADWIYGLNMTRICTLQGRKGGYQGVLSVGRVQTPVLGLVVQRDLEIEHFIAKPFYEVFITLQTATGELFQAKWKPSAACEPYMDEEGRVLSKRLADTVAGKVAGKQGVVKTAKRDNKQQAAPLPYNLSALQIDASKRFNLSAQKTLDVCQQLYERHKLITYPRSDCRYLPKGHFDERHAVTQSIASTAEGLAEAVGNADLTLKSKAWNDAKVGAHHAIIPTSRSMAAARLSLDEQNIYGLIARQYLMQFYPPFAYAEHQIECEVEGGLFIARQKTVLAEGWKALLMATKNSPQSDEFTAQALPDLKAGDRVQCTQARTDEKQTSPPKRFTDATLLAAMTGIARFVSDPQIKKVLRDTDGLGTEATRAGIIELLFKRQFLTRKGKEIHATTVGRQLVASLPVRMVAPDMTAHWESQLEAISDKRLRYGEFMQPLESGVKQLIDEVAQQAFSGLQGMGKRPTKRRTASARKSAGSQRSGILKSR